jgi:hypothetical protein
MSGVGKNVPAEEGPPSDSGRAFFNGLSSWERSLLPMSRERQLWRFTGWAHVQRVG